MSGAARTGAAGDRAAAPEAPLRIGEVAERAGTTPRTVRYYEEIGLLPGRHDRPHGKHRLYDEADVERLRELLRLRDLLGVSLEELKTLVEAEEARAALRRRWERAGSETERRRILEQALEHVEAQLGVVRRRMAELEQLERELTAKRRRQRARLSELERPAWAAGPPPTAGPLFPASAGPPPPSVGTASRLRDRLQVHRAAAAARRVAAGPAAGRPGPHELTRRPTAFSPHAFG